MRVLVTGGAGFIGSTIVRSLRRDAHEVFVIDDLSTGHRRNIEDLVDAGSVTLFVADIASAEAANWIAEIRPEVVLHLAAQASVKVSMQRPTLDATVNAVGLLTVLEAAVAAGTRKVVLATSGGTIYGDVAESRLPIKETETGDPRSFYGLTKRLGVDYLRLFEQEHGLEWVALALGNVYGPGQDPFGEAGVVAIFHEALASGRACVINGDGGTTRDFVFVTDVAAAFTRAMTAGHGLINIGTGVETSVAEVYAELARLFVDAPPCQFGPALPGEVRRVSLDRTKAAHELGWHPTVDFDAGTAQLAAVVTR